MRTDEIRESVLRSYRARLEMAMDHVNYLKKGLYAYVLFVMYNYDQYTGAPIIIVLLIVMAFIDSLLHSLLEVESDPLHHTEHRVA